MTRGLRAYSAMNASAAGPGRLCFFASLYSTAQSAMSARMGGSFTMNSVAPVPAAFPISPTAHRISM